KATDTQCLETHLDIGTLSHAYYKGYADRDRLLLLLQGKVADYRDNYFAGYSLYAFLRGVPLDQPRYREALPGYEKRPRGGQAGPVGWFTSCFCDGKNGRPASFDDFAADWARCLRACYEYLDGHPKGHEWLAKYTPPEGEAGGEVGDAPTWSWGRVRAEPFFG